MRYAQLVMHIHTYACCCSKDPGYIKRYDGSGDLREAQVCLFFIFCFF